MVLVAMGQAGSARAALGLQRIGETAGAGDAMTDERAQLVRRLMEQDRLRAMYERIGRDPGVVGLTARRQETSDRLAELRRAAQQ